MLAWRAGLDPQGNWVSDRWVAFTGCTLDQAGGDRWWPLVHPDEREACRTAYCAAYASRRPFELEYRLRHCSGEYRQVVDAGMPVLGDDGKFSGYLGYCVDLSSVDQSDESFSRLQERHQSILHSMIDGVFGIDASGNTTLVNPAVTAILGWSAEDLLGKNRHASIHHAHADGTVYDEEACPVTQTIRDGQVRSVDTECFWRKDGNAVRVAYVCAPITDKKGQINGAVVTFRDISEKIQAREALQVAQEQLQVIFHSVPAMIFYKDRSNRILRANWYAAVACGCSTQELEGKQMEDLLPLDAAEYYRADLEVFRTSRPTRGIIERYYNKACEERWAETDRIPYVGSGGQIEGVIVFSRDITDRKQVEQALRVTEAQFKAAFEVMSVGYAQADLSGHYFRVNRRFCEMTGYSEDELLTISIADITHPDDREKNKEELERVLKRQSPGFRLEKRYVRKDGSIWWGDLTVNVCCDETGVPLWTMAVHYDVTDRKRVEAALRLSEERWQFALAASQDGVWDWDLQSAKAYVSERYSEIMGYEPSEIVPTYEWWISHIHPDDRHNVESAIQRHLDGQTNSFVVEYRVRTKEGNERWVFDRGKVMVRDEAGAPLRMVGTLTDITERKGLEAAFIEAQQRWAFAIEGSQDGVWDWEPDTNRTYFSSRWKSMLGYGESDIEHTYAGWRDLVYPDDLGDVEAALRDYLEGRSPRYESRYRMRAKNGEYRWILGRGKVISRLPDGRPGRVVGTNSDITEMVNADAALRASEERWQFALEGSQDGVWDWCPMDGRAYFSPRWKGILGYTDAEIANTYQAWKALIHPEDVANAEQAVSDYLAGKTPTYSTEFRMRAKGGGYRWILARGKIMARLPDGRPLRVVGTHTDVTERKLAEEELRLSEERWKFALEGSESGVWDWHVDTDEVFFSSRWSQMLGYGPESKGMLVKEWAQHVHPSDFAKATTEMRRHLRGETDIYVSEIRVKTHDGTYRWILDRGKVMTWSPEGRPVRVLGTHTDISFLKQLQESLIESQVQFTEAFVHAPIGKALIGLDGRWLKVNPALCKILGYSEQELLRMRFQDVTYVDDLLADVGYVLELLSGQRTFYQLEKRYVTKSGNVVWVQRSVSYIPEIGGRSAYFIAQVEDITARKQAEAALRRSEAQFVSFMDNLKGFAWIKDESGVYTYANQELTDAVVRLKGAGVSLIGKTDGQVSSPEFGLLGKGDRSVLRLMRPIQRTEQFGEGKAASIKLLVKFPLRGNAQDGVQLGGLAIDITKRVRAEEALKKSQRRLKMFLEEREQMSRDLHDNSIQMLYAIGMDLYCCRNLLQEKANIAQCVEVIGRSVERVNSVIRGLRTHLMSRRLPQRKTPDEVRREIQQVLQQIGGSAGLSVITDISSAALAALDQKQTAEVLAIIREGFSNVVRHARAQHCAVTLASLPESTCLEVKDDGVGGAFVGRSRSSRTHGLRNMEARAKKIGASFAVVSAQGAGTIVRVCIPRG